MKEHVPLLHLKTSIVDVLECKDIDKINNYLKKKSYISEKTVKNNNTTSGAIQVTYFSVLFVSLDFIIIIIIIFLKLSIIYFTIYIKYHKLL